MGNPHPQNTWPKGRSGNTKGRPKEDWTWSGLLKEVAQEIDPRNKEEFKRAVAKGLFKAAAAGNPTAAKVLMDRMDGMPMQSTKLDLGDETLKTLIKLDTK